MIIFHGSENIIYKPEYGKGSAANDYGRGFYCTESIDMTKEWACKRNRDGFANKYSLDIDGLKVCDLNDGTYNILNWLALLTRYRGYWQRRSIAEEAKEFLQTNYLIDISPFDVIIGYRADDSYFSFVQDFIMGTISLQKLSEAMRLGKLGEQVVLKSEKAFERISYLSNEEAPAEIYYPKMATRDLDARRRYADNKRAASLIDEIYILDILRGRGDYDEVIIQDRIDRYNTTKNESC